jgi:mono/diheme cytochrome c family protein
MKWLVSTLMSAMVLASACEAPDAALPAAYREVAVPSERLRSADARQRGRRLYVEHCSLCHGVKADGRGVRREGLSRPPADFTSSAWRQGATPRRVYFAIREGVRGTPMPSWKALAIDDTWDLVAYLLALAERPE